VEEGGTVVRHYKVYNIVWDKEVDGVEVDVALPDSVSYDIPHGVDAEDEICNRLSDYNGYCVYSFEYDLVSETKGYVLHFRQTIDGLETDTPRYWRCDADNYEHAVEQLKDHIERELGEKVTFVEMLGTKI
jgi:hypothetical protein